MRKKYDCNPDRKYRNREGHNEREVSLVPNQVCRNGISEENGTNETCVTQVEDYGLSPPLPPRGTRIESLLRAFQIISIRVRHKAEIVGNYRYRRILGNCHEALKRVERR